MFEVLFLFPRSGDLAAIDEFLAQRLIPQLTSAAGLRTIRISQDALMSPGGPPPYGRVLEASFDALADVMAVVEESKRHPAEREQLDRLGPLVLLYEVTERSPPTACSIGSSRRTAKAR
jgi:hypothetical protein